MATLTGADVASSTDKTGNALLDGDWDLEYSVGVIDTSVVVSDAVQNAWNELLTVENLTGAWTTTEPYSSTTTATILPVTVDMSFSAPAGTIVQNVTADNLTTNVFFSDAYVQGADSVYMEILWDDTPEASDDAQTVTVTFTFDTAVVNPILHIDRLGGSGGWVI
ncbi:MAG: DUF4347 domain-containing protein [Epsilonproteobacteria bacterium]|nr:DUF4347 domain-containing protein [Campylobacterota bacterium]